MVPEPELNPTVQPGPGHPLRPAAVQPPHPQPDWPPVQPVGWAPPYGTAPGWVPPPAKPEALPVTLREYHEFFRTPRYRWWKPVLSLLLFIAAWLLASLVIGFVGISSDWASGRVDPSDTMAGEITMTPALFTANNLSLAAAIPLAGLAGWAVFGQRPRWMSSIVGRFRWALFWRFALATLPLMLLSLGVEVLRTGPPELAWNPDSLFLIVVILLTTPLQAAGEEYGVRGLMARSIGSWFASARVGLVVATAITSVVFMLLHGAGDPWLNGYYFGMGVIFSLLVWRTGGLEASVALHVVNNLVGEFTLPFGGLESVFDRGAGVAGPEILIQVFFTVAITALLWWLGGRARLPRSAAPAAVEPSGWR